MARINQSTTTSSSNSDYINTSTMTPEQKKTYETTNVTADSNTDKTVAIDGSTSTTTNSNVDQEANSINLKLDATIDSTLNGTTSSDKFIKITFGFVLVLLTIMF
jgi:hypothetical protein